MTRHTYLRIFPPLLLLPLVGLLTACDMMPPRSVAPAQVEQITLERYRCLGFCPVYTLTISGEGRVDYDGKEFVAVTGAQSSTIDSAAVQALGNEMVAAGYLDWADAYMDQDVTDHPYVYTSLTLSDGTTKRIEHYHGDLSAPEALAGLEDRIDETAGSSQWVGEPQP